MGMSSRRRGLRRRSSRRRNVLLWPEVVTGPVAPFPCTRCGCCCRRVGGIPDFPEPIREDGSCSHLTPNNECAIYDTRPLICRIDDLYLAKAETAPMSHARWRRLNILACNEMMDDDGAPPGLRITVPEE